MTVAASISAAFAQELRSAGLGVPIGSSVAFTEALGCVGTETRSGVYWAGRATLVVRPESTPTYDAVFEHFWMRREALDFEAAVDEEVITLATDDSDESNDGDGEELSDDTILVRYSAAETLRTKDFAQCDDAELAEAYRLMEQLRLSGALRKSLRLKKSKRSGRTDLRRTVQAALRNEGEPLRLYQRNRGTRKRRLVLLLDISGSMESYARALLRFSHIAVAGRTRVEVFALGTRLTRLTRELSTRDPDVALRAATGSVEDWSGGTRLGESLGVFNQLWGVRGMARGATVVILSDGWDRGAPETMSENMERLARVAHRIVWVNPLKATPDYAPLAQGMAAALPYVDDFVEGHSLQSLEELAEVLAA
jgi:uncharacterized protein with von Willebrand factor type A (vWA) domain